MSIPKTMKAVVCKEFNKPLSVEEVPVPKIRKDQILVKIEACGVCHTDLHAIKGDWPVKPNPPFIPGHEGVGRVVEIGESVKNCKLGDRVGVPWLYSACGVCDHCLQGWETLCTKQQNSGYSVNGAFAEYVAADPLYVGHVPEDANALEVAPILCAGLTVYKGLKMTEAKAGQWVVVSGLGGLGYLALQYAKAMGLNVIGVDINDDKLVAAKKGGADLVVNALKQDPVAFAHDNVGGAHGALVTAVSPIAFKQAMGYVRNGGTIVLNGLPPGEFGVDIFSTVLKGLTIRGSIVGTRYDMVEALRFFSRGQVRSSIIPDKMENINEIFEGLEKGTITGRKVLDFSK